MIAVVVDGPTAVTASRATMITGSASTASTMRPRMSSTSPRM